MTNRNSTKRMLLISVMAMLLCCTMLIGTTFAWFTDTASSTGNKIVAGTLDVKLLMYTGNGYEDISNTTESIFGDGSIAQNNNLETVWEPGKTQVAYLAIENAGNLDLKYQVALSVENVSKNLYEVMQYAITPDAQNGAVTAWNATDAQFVVVGTQTVSGENAITLEVGETHYFALSVHMLETAGNEYQGGQVNFDLVVLATQVASEEDSFDNQYDANPEDPDFYVSTIAELENAVNNATEDVTVDVIADLAGDATLGQKANVNVIINGNGHAYNGSITVDGKSARYETASMTIKNFSFNGNNITEDACIRLGGDNSMRYTANVTVKDCVFNGENDAKVAVKSYTGGDWNLTISGCTVNAGMHSMLQVTNVEKGLTITDCKVYSKNGINLNNTPSLEMSGCEFDVKGYAVRFGVSGNTLNGVFNISNSTLKSACAESDDAVIVFRGTMTGSVLTLTNTTLTGTRQTLGDNAPAINGLN